MKRKTLWFVASATVLFGALAAYPTNAAAQVVVVEPPAAYIASYEPVYYNGFAHYLYHDHWYYRDHGGVWRGYDHEPGFLHDQRGGWGHHWHHWR